MALIPPSPIDAPFGSYNWADWYEKVRRAINSAAIIQWNQISFSGGGGPIVPVLNGGTGTSTPALVAGTNVTLSGTWPNNTINASDASKLPLAGGTLIGNLILSYASPILRLNATTTTNGPFSQFVNASGNFYVGLENSAGGNFGVPANSATLMHTGAFPMILATNSAERMRIDSSGNVGIGGAASGARLHSISGSATPAMRVQDAGTNQGTVLFGNNFKVQGGDDYAGGQIVYGAVTLMKFTSSQVQDGNGLELGYKGIPRNTTPLTSGQCSAIAAGFTFGTGNAAGTTFYVYNDSAAAITITQGVGLTMRLGGTATTGSRILAARTFATFWCNSTTEVIVTGNGVT